MTNNRHIPVLLSVLLMFVIACGVTAPAVMAQLPMPTTASKTPVLATGTPFTAKNMPTASPNTSCKVIALKSLNLRAEPSDKAAADSDGLQHGDVVSVKCQENGWLFVTIRDGRSGWVKAEFVECEK